MFRFFARKKAKAVMRTKIVAVFLDNFIRLKNGKEVDEWGNSWEEKSFNDVISFFKDNETNFKIKAKFDLVPMIMGSVVKNIDDLSIYDSYNVLYKIYFDSMPSDSELDMLRYDFKSEVAIRGLPINI